MKYIRLFENLSDKVKPGDYIHYYNERKQRIDSEIVPFIIKVHDDVNKSFIKVSLVLYKEDNEWKVCKENPKFYNLINEFKMPKDSFNTYGRLITQEEKEQLKKLEFRLTAVDYNL